MEVCHEDANVTNRGLDFQVTVVIAIGCSLGIVPYPVCGLAAEQPRIDSLGLQPEVSGVTQSKSSGRSDVNAGRNSGHAIRIATGC